jgi:hypothetical protein
MKDNYFDDILKNSMETPRAIPFDESAWERMEQQMPKSTTSSTWKTWFKYMPIAIGILGLLTWNICLQREVNYMQEHPNVVIETKAAEQKIIYRIDTVYQITERRITKEAIKNYLEQYVSNNGSSHTNNHFVTPTNRSSIESNSLITSNSNSRFSGSYNPVSLKNNLIIPTNRNFFTNSVYNPNFSNLNFRNGNSLVQMDSVQINKQLNASQAALANQMSNNGDNLGVQNALNSKNKTTGDDTNERNNTETEVIINEEIASENSLTELESKPIQEVHYYQNLNIADEIDIVDISRPSKIKPTFRSKFRFDEFSVGIGNTVSANLVNNATLTTIGLHAGAYILPNTSVEVELNHLNNNYFISPHNIFPNSYPYPADEEIPADYNLNGVSLDLYSFQASLGLKRIVFKDEHIRPFGEIGWLVNKEFAGDIFYTYSKREGNQTSFGSNDLIQLDNTDYLKWDFSQVYAGGGLSFSLLKGKVDLDLGIRFTQSLNSLQRFMFNSNLTGTSAVGYSSTLTYNF